MSILSTRVNHAERMMTQAIVVKDGIELTFADGCKGVIPFKDIPEAGNPADLTSIELPNPYQVNIRGSQGEIAELPWDFVRHYCDSAYRQKAEAMAVEGTRVLGKRIREMREAAGLTQAEMAAAAGIGRVTAVRIENGEQSPRYETLVAIAKALRRRVADILTGE